MRVHVLKQLACGVLALLWMRAAAYASETPLVADLAEPVVEISYAFSGAKLLIFGATECVQDNAALPCHLIAVIEGPAQEATVRRKERMTGLWVNGTARKFSDVPSYYAFAASAPVEDIVDDKVAKALALGLPNLPFTSTDGAQAREDERFKRGLLDDRARKGLYVADRQSIIIREGRLFRMSFAAPATVPTGDYAIRIYAVKDNQVIAKTQQSLVVRKAGFEAFVTRGAKNQPLIYAIVSVILALSIGFVSASAFKS